MIVCHRITSASRKNYLGVKRILIDREHLFWKKLKSVHDTPEYVFMMGQNMQSAVYPFLILNYQPIVWVLMRFCVSRLLD